MDCLQHYCLQLDFAAGKMRFLDPNGLNSAELGAAFPLTFSRKGRNSEYLLPLLPHPRLTGGAEAPLLVDTGCDVDGSLGLPLFRQEVRRQQLHLQGEARHGPGAEAAWLPKCVWNGATYTNLWIGAGPDLMGLRFLARHLVTLNFPRRTLYLRQTSVGPLGNEYPAPGPRVEAPESPGE